MKVQRKLATAFALLLFCNLSSAQKSVEPSPCTVGQRAAGAGFWTWPAKARVKVFVVANDFSAEEQTFLLGPLQNWNLAAAKTGSGVVFEFRGDAPARRDCENCLTIMRGDVFDEVRRHATELRAFSAHSDQFITHAAIVVDRSLTNPRAVGNAIAHELGHSFGLYDCFTCAPRTTVMAQFKAVNVANEMEGPTACDLAQVKASYLLASKRKRGTFANLPVDEGEEPEDDDTPIVVPASPR